jgi:hypothetical protein
MRKHLIAIIVLALAGAASADPPGLSPEQVPDLSMNVDAPPPDRVMSDRAVHFDLGMTSSLGRFTSGDMKGDGMLGIDYGFRRGRLTLIGEADYAETEPMSGNATGKYLRLAVADRVAFVHDRTVIARTADGTPTESRVRDLWIETGVGQSAATQAMGPAIRREDVSVGIGFTALRQHATYAWGGFAAVRMIDSGFAERGPQDVSVMLTSGMFFGR